MTAEPPTLPDVILITGAMAAGKSSLAHALAERLPQSVHLRGDIFRCMMTLCVGAKRYRRRPSQGKRKSESRKQKWQR